MTGVEKYKKSQSIIEVNRKYKMNNSKKVQDQNVEMSLENLEINIDQAQIIADDELKAVTGGTSSFINDQGFCSKHM
ncbi:MAG: hypothetical protein ACI8WB_005849 [Phenylobacterium sp.]